MSSYLTFKKGGVPIASYNRSSAVYRAFDNKAPWDEFEEMKPEVFFDAFENCQLAIDAMKLSIDTDERVLIGVSDVQHRYEIIEDINDTKKQLEEMEKAKLYIKFLKNIFEETDFEGNNFTMEWGIF